MSESGPDTSTDVNVDTGRFARERAAAIGAVRAAAVACRAVSETLVTEDTVQKKDRSPVTVADFASQAIVCEHLQRLCPNDPVVAEETSGELAGPDQQAVRRAVVERVGHTLGGAHDDAQVMAWIDRGGALRDATPGPPTLPRFWTLDPIDGTKGFLRGGQYAVALALIENGRVVLGALGCPNLDGLNGEKGVLLVAAEGMGTTVLSLNVKTKGGGPGEPARVSAVTDTHDARFCESVESGHSSHGTAASIAKALGITAEPVRMDSQAKYATVARGQASIYMRLPTRKDYREMIWDHAAGMIAVTAAGGRVTDITGRDLDFSLGRRLENNRGVIATNGHIHDAVIAAINNVLG